MASPNMTLKLLVDKERRRVLFAEAPKEFVDFLFHIFSLPLSTLVQFLGSNQMVGCLGKLKQSVDSFNETHFQPGIHKDDIFNFKTVFNGNMFLSSNLARSDDDSATSKTLYGCLANCCFDSSDLESNTIRDCQKYVSEYDEALCPACHHVMRYPMVFVVPAWKKARADNVSTTSRRFYCCNSNGGSVTEDENALCPFISLEDSLSPCNCLMSVPLIPVLPASLVTEAKSRKKKGGYVKEGMSYMVMDDLVVKSMSPLSSITAMNEFGLKDFSLLEEKIVSFGKNEGLEVIKNALASNTVLTNVFLSEVGETSIQSVDYKPIPF